MGTHTNLLSVSRLIDPVQERAWIAGLKAGRVDVFRDLFETYVPPLRRFARVWTPRDVAEDLVQDVLFDVWQRREQLQPDGRLVSYLFTAVRNQAIKYVRHQGIVSRAEDANVFLDRPELGEGPTAPDQAVLAEDLHHAVRHAIAKLPDVQRAVLLLRWVEGLSYQQIAAALEITENAAMLHVSRARRTLQPVLRGIVRDEA
jgi:RNA polymerase sigma-70 factor (ECF subfamily)